MSLTNYEKQEIRKPILLYVEFINTQIVKLLSFYDEMVASHESKPKTWREQNDKVIEYEKAIDNMYDSASDMAKSGFIDLLPVEDLGDLDESCRNLISELNLVIKKMYHAIYECPDSRRLMFTSATAQSIQVGRILQLVEAALTPCEELDELQQKIDLKSNSRNRIELKKMRLEHMTSQLCMSTHMPTINYNEHCLRVISQKLHTDKDITNELFNSLSVTLIDRINESKCMAYITQNEMYSLLMLLLSRELSESVMQSVNQALLTKLAAEQLPHNIKQHYYVVFIEIIYIHCVDMLHQQDVVEQMIRTIDNDIQSLLDKHGLSSTIDPTSVTELLEYFNEECKEETQLSHTLCQFMVLKTLMKTQLECNIFTVADPVDQSAVYQKQMNIITALSNVEVSAEIRNVMLKLMIMLQASQVSSQLVQNWRNRCDRHITGLFYDYTADISVRTQRFIKSIWMDPFTSCDLQTISQTLAEYEDGRKLPAWYVFDQLIDEALNQMEEVSIHREFSKP